MSVPRLLLDPLELNAAEGDGVLNTEPSSRAGGDCPQELARVVGLVEELPAAAHADGQLGGRGEQHIGPESADVTGDIPA
jgi:hypothetical protein